MKVRADVASVYRGLDLAGVTGRHPGRPGGPFAVAQYRIGPCLTVKTVASFTRRRDEISLLFLRDVQNWLEFNCLPALI